MTGQVVRAPHRCEMPYAEASGTVWQCGCGKHWILRTYLNSGYDRWVRLYWLGRKLRRLP